MAAQIQDDNKFTGIRLPTNIRPILYNLTLQPDLVKFTFDGSVDIHYEKTSNEKLDSVVLNSKELVISDGKLGDEPLKSVTYSNKTETATLQFDSIPDKGVISLKFTGILNDNMKGFYRSACVIDGKTHYAATTQFESTDARRCFPCWDEPAVKSKFQVTLKYPATNNGLKNVALSNMAPTSHTTGDIETIVYGESPIMSTYLLAFIVGPFECIESEVDGRPVRVYTTIGKKHQGQFALDVACKSLKYYEDYFNIKYPLPKMDLIAIPDFTSGAMENWGLVTYRETCLLFDPENSALDRKQFIAIVVAHELAHQWFGNLVTMEWWTHLWLNEGFAQFMEHLCVDSLLPEYEVWMQFVNDSYNNALVLDALNNSHPIEVPVEHPSEIEEIFDSISYDKGASVIRMLYNYIGDESFRKGMTAYLNKFQYKNAVTEDLWAALEQASSKPITRFMSDWTSQKGYPWLAVETVSQDADKVKLRVTQKKFVADGVTPEEDKDRRWFVPLYVVTADSEKPVHIGDLTERSAEFVVENPGNGYIKLNPGCINLYRAAYSQDILDKLRTAVSDQSLQAVDRFSIVNDAQALCQAGYASTVDLLKLLQVLNNETNYTVWRAIDSSLGRLSNLVAETDAKKALKKFTCDLYNDIYQKLSWTPKAGEKHTDKLLRSLVINRLVASGHQEVIQESKLKFKNHYEQKDIINPDLRSAVYRVAAEYGDQSQFDQLLDIYNKAELAEEKNRVLRSLAFVPDGDRLKFVTDFVLSDKVRNQDRIHTIIALGCHNTPAAWKLLQDQKDFFRKQYLTGHLITYIVKYSTDSFTTEERAKEVETFFKQNPFPGAERTVQQSLESIRTKAKWFERDIDAIKSFFGV